MSEPAKNERYAEKDRTATCAFADVVARAAREACEAQCPGFLDATLHSTEQTVLAAILLTHEAASPSQDTQNEPKVLSLGIGTKFVRQYVKEADKVHGCRVHDAHAEVLARRAFLQVVMREIAKLHRDGTSDFLITDPETHRARLAPGAHLHLYTSSTPCGNSSVRRWASGKPEPPVPTDLAAHVWPQLPHGTLSLASRAEGQIAASVKRDLQIAEDEKRANYKVEDSTTKSANDNGVATTTAGTESVHLKKKSKPSKPVFASGTAEPDSGQGNILSCSDKIAMWNLVGLQSKWLVDIVDPLYLSTLVVGRKFSRRHLERAVCCRLQEVPACGPFRLHHPVLLRTSVKLNSGNVAQDAEAAFSNNIAVHWARGDIAGASYLRGDEGLAVPSKSQRDKMNCIKGDALSSAERVDAGSGGEHHGAALTPADCAGANSNIEHSAQDQSRESSICRKALLELLRQSCSSVHSAAAVPICASENTSSKKNISTRKEQYSKVKSQALEVLKSRDAPAFAPRKKQRKHRDRKDHASEPRAPDDAQAG